MVSVIQQLDQHVERSGTRGVYIVAIQNLDLDALPAMINGRPVTAIAPHPRDEDRLYVTTEHPEALAFLPDPYMDLRP